MYSNLWYRRSKEKSFNHLQQIHQARMTETINSKEVRVTMGGPSEPLKITTTLNKENNIVDIALTSSLDSSPLFNKYISLNNYSLNQLCRITGVPYSYIRTLRTNSDLARANLKEGLKNMSTQVMKIYYNESSNHINSINSSTYERVYDHEVIQQVIESTNRSSGKWTAPNSIVAAEGGLPSPKSLYLSDRSMHIFLVDEESPIISDGDTYFKGFMVSNSEVGSSKIVVSTFLYRKACANRMVWGFNSFASSEYKHTRYVRSRMEDMFRNNLDRFLNEDVGELAHRMQLLKSQTIKDSSFLTTEKILRKCGFTLTEAKKIISGHNRTEHRNPVNKWDITQAITSYAGLSAFQDQRVKIESKIAKLTQSSILDSYFNINV